MKFEINTANVRKPVITYPCLARWIGGSDDSKTELVVLFDTPYKGIALIDTTKHGPTHRGYIEWVPINDKNWEILPEGTTITVK